MARSVIVTCAITGSIHTPTMSPHLPVTPGDIAAQAIAAAEAGASVLHLHARDPADGRPSADPSHFAAFLPEIARATDAVINISTGGSSLMDLGTRLAPARAFAPEMCSLNMGSMNFGIFPLKGRYRDWHHDWEPQLLEATRDTIFRNTFSDIEAIVTELGAGGTRFEFECYDTGHIETLAFYLREGLVAPPLYVQFVMGVLGGSGATPENLMHLKATADRLLGDAHEFSVLAAGGRQIPLATMGAILGGNVRVGLEDSLSIARGRLAGSNAEQVAKIRRILEELGHEVATPEEVRTRLALKGRAATSVPR